MKQIVYFKKNRWTIRYYSTKTRTVRITFKDLLKLNYPNILSKCKNTGIKTYVDVILLKQVIRKWSCQDIFLSGIQVLVFKNSSSKYNFIKS